MLITLEAVAPTARAGAAPGPPIGALFQYQLSTGPQGPGGIDLNVCATGARGPCHHPTIFDIDLDGPNGTTPNAAAVRAIHARGDYAICYVDAGTWERWRPDARLFPARLRGRPNGWPGERWLDIRAVGTLMPIMARRVARCASAGFDAVDFDNVDGYANVTGFPLTPADQLRYNRGLAALAHRDHLAVGLKNDLGQVAELEPVFDFAIDEQCVAYHQCPELAPFVRAHKAVYDVEYTGSLARDCAAGLSAGVSVILKSRALGAVPWRPCLLRLPRPRSTAARRAT